MHHILIVDDEPIVVQSISHIIKTDIERAILIEKARNGREAIEKAFSFRPDLVITDIKMPGINGLDVIMEIKAHHANTRFVILSAYDQFSFAKEAVALGVEEYLLKPVSRQRMAETILKCLNKIEHDQEKIKRDLMLKEKMEKMLPSVESGFLLSALFFDEISADASNILEMQSGGGMIVAELSGGREPDKAFGIICYDALKQQGECLVCKLSPGKIAAFIPAAGNCIGKEHVVSLTKKLIQSSRDKGLCIAVGIGGIRGNFDEIKESYGEAVSALNVIQKDQPSGGLLHFDEIKNSEWIDHDSANKKKKFFSKLMMGDFLSAIQEFEDIFNWFKSISGGDFNKLKEKAAEIMAMIAVKVYDEEIPDDQELVVPVFNAKNAVELQEICMEKIMKLSAYAGSLNRKRISEMVSRANEMIGQRYADNVTLECIAKDLGITPSYFSRLYKQQTGYNFIDYLIKVRIENAKRLFQTSDLSVKEVSYKTGYIDPNYFSRMFKKITGMTPTEFKLNIDSGRLTKTV